MTMTIMRPASFLVPATWQQTILSSLGTATRAFLNVTHQASASWPHKRYIVTEQRKTLPSMNLRTKLQHPGPTRENPSPNSGRRFLV
mmetsp:Transcript_34065/g.67037  ORF Transcript_34065/g.67037 Transcript_34065/m.67037 type:complete len:87 (+) Transcript_34065:846-1106(+)